MQPSRSGRTFKGLGVAKRYCERGSIGDSFVQGAMIKHWAFARGGAWRNPKPTGGLYICEQCRLEACARNARNYTLLLAVTEVELVLADVCADCGARLLEEREPADQP